VLASTSHGEATEAPTRSYGVIVGITHQCARVEIEGAMNLPVRAGSGFEPSTRLRLTGDYVSYADSGSASLFLPPGTRGTVVAVWRAQSPRRSEALVLRGAVGLVPSPARAPGPRCGHGRLSSFHNMVSRPYLRAERTGCGFRDGLQPEYVGLDATVAGRGAPLGPILAASGSGQVEAPARGATSPARPWVVAETSGPRSASRQGGGNAHCRGDLLALARVPTRRVRLDSQIVTATTRRVNRRVTPVGGVRWVWSEGGGAPLFSQRALTGPGAGVGGGYSSISTATGRGRATSLRLRERVLLVGNAG